MAIKYLDAKRLQGTNAERLALTTGYTDGNGLNGTATSITVDTDDEPSFTTGCYEFDGSPSKITISDSIGTTAFSVSLWVKTTVTTGEHGAYSQVADSTNNGMHLYQAGSPPHMSCSQGAGGTQVVSSTNLSTDGTWYNVIFTKTAGVGDGVANLYVTPQDGSTSTNTHTDWNDFQAGQTSLISSHQGDWWNGSMTDFATWNKVISSATRTAINAGSGALISSLSDKSGITTYYPFTSLSGSTVTNMATAVYPNLPNGAIFNETDTYKYFMWDGTDTWNQMVSS